MKRNTRLAPVGRRGKRLAEGDRKFQGAVRLQWCGLCCICKCSGRDAHHIHGRAAHPELRHEPLNGALLCRRCHDWAGDYPKAFRALFARLHPQQWAKLQEMRR